MKIFTTLTLAGALAVSAPALALAEDTSPSTKSPAQQCKQQRDGAAPVGIGAAAFKELYGTNKNKSNAFGKCVSKKTASTEAAAKTAHTNASKECDAEEALDAAAFKAKYGTGKNGNNAHGKCVSGKAKAKTDAAVAATLKAEGTAAKSCKTERSADPAAFKAKYGTNKNKSNAFGKCVSAKAKAKAPATA
jgi:hypothetical protein